MKRKDLMCITPLGDDHLNGHGQHRTPIEKRDPL